MSPRDATMMDYETQLIGVPMLFRFLGLTLLATSLVASLSLADDSSPIVIVQGAWGGAHHWKAVDQSLTHQRPDDLVRELVDLMKK